MNGKPQEGEPSQGRLETKPQDGGGWHGDPVTPRDAKPQEGEGRHRMHRMFATLRAHAKDPTELLHSEQNKTQKHPVHPVTGGVIKERKARGRRDGTVTGCRKRPCDDPVTPVQYVGFDFISPFVDRGASIEHAGDSL